MGDDRVIGGKVGRKSGKEGIGRERSTMNEGKVGGKVVLENSGKVEGF